jgi:enterochelin esterase-like enzyme
LDFRSQEYLVGFNQFTSDSSSHIFKNHLLFFGMEVPEWIESKFQIANDSNKRLLFGSSNGASFVLMYQSEYPNYFGRTLCFAIGWDFELKEYPCRTRYTLRVGTDDSFKIQTKKWAEKIDSAGCKVDYELIPGKHEQKDWDAALAKWLVDNF